MDSVQQSRSDSKQKISLGSASTTLTVSKVCLLLLIMVFLLIVYNYIGHEASYIIISTVRTRNPGFLKSLNRVNVMLTRCQSGMVVVTNRSFLVNSGRDTLLWILAQQWREWGDSWIDMLALLNGSANLPGINHIGAHRNVESLIEPGP